MLRRVFNGGNSIIQRDKSVGQGYANLCDAPLTIENGQAAIDGDRN